MPATRQPLWKLVANMGDATPLDYGGYFIYVDETGVYPPEAEYLETPCEDELGEDGEGGTYVVYRFCLDRCTWDAERGILSDNPYHLDSPAWFAQPESERAARPRDSTYLRGPAECCDIAEAELVRLFCSADPLELAEAYRVIASYHGWHELDHDPLYLTRAEAEVRYTSALRALKG